MVSVGSQLWKFQGSRTFFFSPKKTCVMQKYFQREGNSKTMLSIGCLYALSYNFCVLLFSNITISISPDSYKHFEGGKWHECYKTPPGEYIIFYFCLPMLVYPIVAIINSASIDIFVHKALPSSMEFS